MLALLGWQLGHGTALQPWPSTLSISIITASVPKPKSHHQHQFCTWQYSLIILDQMTDGVSWHNVLLAPCDAIDSAGMSLTQRTVNTQHSDNLPML